MTQSIAASDITGLVLAGGQGSRMGGVDKGLQLLGDLPLALHALQRLRPQVGAVMVNANRNLLEYEFFGAPVWPDASADFAGPLAGFLAGLTHCETPFMLTVPCDVPGFPLDLAERLGKALVREHADIAMAASYEGDAASLEGDAASLERDASSREGDGVVHRQPVFCLMRVELRDDLARFLAEGGRKVGAWIERHTAMVVPFENVGGFVNVNTLDDLAGMQLGKV
jgi:molybdopterin-guanine dinucleotide biosynthesis protein A